MQASALFSWLTVPPRVHDREPPDLRARVQRGDVRLPAQHRDRPAGDRHDMQQDGGPLLVGRASVSRRLHRRHGNLWWFDDDTPAVFWCNNGAVG